MIERYLKIGLVNLIKGNGSVRNILLLGPRQTGKSTLINSMINNDAVKYDFRELSTYREVIKSPEIIKQGIEYKLESKDSLVIFLDEIQLIPEILNDVQVMIDTYKKRVSFIVTGSSARKLRRGKANLLPGRIFSLRLDPLCLWELGIKINHGIIPWKKTNFKATKTNLILEDILKYGLLPGIYTSSQRELLLKSYCETYLKEEIKEETMLRNIGSFERFLEFASLTSGRPLTYTSLASESSVSIDTIKNYFQILYDTLIVETFDVWIPSRTKRILLSQKRVFFDTGVRNALSLELQSESKEHYSSLFEDFIGLELLKRIRLQQLNWKIFHYRTKDGAEVDWILEIDNNEIIPIEVKYSKNIGKSDLRTLKILLSTYPDKIKRCLIIYLGISRKIEKNIYALNWHDF